MGGHSETMSYQVSLNNNYIYVSERKTSWLTGCHPNLGKIFMIFTLPVLKVLKKAIVQPNIRLENFCDSLKIHKTT